MLQGLRDQNFGLGRCRGCLASVPAVARKGVGEMKLKRGEERGLSLGMNQGRRQKKERCQKKMNCQKICYNAFAPEMTGVKLEPKQKCDDYLPCEGTDQKHLEAAHKDAGREGEERNRQNQLPRTG